MVQEGGPALVTVFDGHNDMLLRLSRGQGAFFDRSSEGHIDLPRAREGGFGGGFCAVFVPTPLREENGTVVEAPLDLRTAQQEVGARIALLFQIVDQSAGAVRVVRTASELEACLREGVFAALLHIEGAEAIDPELTVLPELYDAGLRSLGPVWSRSNVFGHGVPFLFGQSPDTGPGLTPAGRDLVRACNRLGIMIDLSHLNEKGFWDVAELTDAPLVATHSNAHALAPSTRNLTERQLAAIAESDGMVGVNFCVSFLRPDGESRADTPLDVIADHVDYLVERLGIDRVGFGSDFDGARVPADLGDVGGLVRLLDVLRRRGYDEPSIRKLAHENWVRVLRATWHG